jgi:hypothetical protein
MKLTEAQIRQIIKQELRSVLNEQEGVDYNLILNYLVQNWSGPNGYYKLLQENPRLVERMKTQFAGQSGIKTVLEIQPPRIVNNNIYGSKMIFVANDGKTYKFNYAPTFSSLTDENGRILASTR